ncbi:Interleukin-20 receptor subunit beta [Myotis davidii]|uniref:Interleukin-20 receptor subunit beta n=1 Tax=Myotis davidii TaxID=225400 RepID=L5M473_MYODS|nr:Interleukin-20 receptor subunit beta [Myotis davidii]
MFQVKLSLPNTDPHEDSRRNLDKSYHVAFLHLDSMFARREYESLFMSHIWIPSSRCSPTTVPECDVTDDITATVPYNLRVRAILGSQTSAWSILKPPFNRNSTILTPPGMEVTKDGFHLVVKLEDLGPQFEFLVAYWRREPGAKEHVKTVRSRGVPVHLETMEPAAVYCVKAQTFVKAIGRHSAFSQAECVKVQGPGMAKRAGV